GSAQAPARIIFRATSRLSCVCRALNTTPMPPWPSCSRISKLAIRGRGGADSPDGSGGRVAGNDAGPGEQLDITSCTPQCGQVSWAGPSQVCPCGQTFV